MDVFTAFLRRYTDGHTVNWIAAGQERDKIANNIMKET
jgi:hypothetical protein